MASRHSFQEKVLLKTKLIPKGKVTTYKLIAKACGNSNAARAAGNALNSNPFPIKVPCHRVVKSDESIGEYAFGVKKKKILLEGEGIEFTKNGKIIDFRKKLFKS